MAALPQLWYITKPWHYISALCKTWYKRPGPWEIWIDNLIPIRLSWNFKEWSTKVGGRVGRILNYVKWLMYRYGQHKEVLADKYQSTWQVIFFYLPKMA